jgi:hypothetical protein
MLGVASQVGWWLAPLTVPALLWTTRLRVTRDAPRTVKLSVHWCFIPVRRHRCAVDEVSTSCSSEFGGGTKDDTLELATWEMHCWRPGEVRAWLTESSAHLQTPPARARKGA